MRKSNSRRPALAAFALLFTLAVALPIAGQTAAAEQSLTLRGDPAEEAKEREELFASLADAKNAMEAQPIVSQVWAFWFRAPDAAAAALMERALERRSAGDYSGAVTVLDELIESRPDWAEAWNQRATMRYLLRDFEGSLADIDHVLALEPKHFGALSGQGLILLHLGKMAEAQLALRRAAAIHPFLSERALITGPAGQDI